MKSLNSIVHFEMLKNSIIGRTTNLINPKWKKIHTFIFINDQFTSLPDLSIFRIEFLFLFFFYNWQFFDKERIYSLSKRYSIGTFFIKIIIKIQLKKLSVNWRENLYFTGKHARKKAINVEHGLCATIYIKHMYTHNVLYCVRENGSGNVRISFKLAISTKHSWRAHPYLWREQSERALLP